jgi:membrane-associated phospholipid phosphatase
MRALATLTTKILNPLTTALAAMIMAVLVQQIPVNEKILWLVLGIVAAAVPSVVLYLQFKRGEISSLWSPTARERQKSFLVWAVAAAIFTFVVWWLDAPRLILAFGLVLLGLGVVNLLLTTTLKISIHTEAVTLFVLTAVLAVSVGLIFSVILILLVAWSRLYLKAHDLSEVSFGALVTILIVYFVFSFFGLVTF